MKMAKEPNEYNLKRHWIYVFIFVKDNEESILYIMFLFI